MRCRACHSEEHSDYDMYDKENKVYLCSIEEEISALNWEITLVQKEIDRQAHRRRYVYQLMHRVDRLEELSNHCKGNNK